MNLMKFYVLKLLILLYFAFYLSHIRVPLSLLNFKINATGEEGKSNLSHLEHAER
jgi:hypothetical protein